jgi:hypothetical protein
MTSILFECHHLYYLPNFLPIIEEFQQRGGYSLSASIPHIINDLERRHLCEAVETVGIEFIDGDNEATRQAELRSRKFDVVIVGIPGMLEKVVSDNTLAVMVYHGIGLKESYYRDNSPRINIRTVESQERYDELTRRGETNLVLTGYTKIDPLASMNSQTNNQFLETLDLSPERPTLLYAPTFYPSSVEQVLPKLPGLAQRMNVIIKLHGFSWSQRRYKHHSEQAKQIAGQGIYLATREDYNIVPYYLVSDILLSDISSTLFEYLALDRPIIQTTFYKPRLKHRILKSRLRKRLDLARTEKINFTQRLDHPEELEALVSKTVKNPDSMSRMRQEAADHYLYRTDGKASVRLVDAIEEQWDKDRR